MHLPCTIEIRKYFYAIDDGRAKPHRGQTKAHKTFYNPKGELQPKQQANKLPTWEVLEHFVMDQHLAWKAAMG